LSQSEAKDFATLDCKINGSDITFYERSLRFFTRILSPYSLDFRGDALAYVFYITLGYLVDTFSLLLSGFV